jgi:hypothetical protein
MKKLILLLSFLATISHAENMASALARGCTPVLLPPGQSLGNVLVQTGAVTNNQTNVVLGLASGTTCATATQTNEPVTLAQLESAVNGLLSTPLYGATNIHPVLGAGYFSFHGTIPSVQWTNTYVLGTAYALVGNRFDTNSTAGGTTITALSAFDHHVYCSVDALNGGVYYSRVVYVKSDRTATQEIYSGTEVIPTTSIRELTSSSTAPTNITLGAGTWYLGVERYAKRNSGAAVTLSIYGGDGTPTRLEIPSSLSPSGTFATKQYVDSQVSASASAGSNWVGVVSNSLASVYQPWTAILTPPASGGTTLVSFANGTLPLLVCTGAQTVAIDPGGGWGANGVNRLTLGLYIGSASVTIATNNTPSGCNIRWGNTISLSTTRTNRLLYSSVGTNDWVVYGSL